MRMTEETFVELAEGIATIDTEYNREQYRKGNFPRSDRTQDVDKRYRWDLYWVAQRTMDRDALRYYSDAHIDTALRRIVPGLFE